MPPYCVLLSTKMLPYFAHALGSITVHHFRTLKKEHLELLLSYQFAIGHSKNNLVVAGNFLPNTVSVCFWCFQHMEKNSNRMMHIVFAADG
jgi:hypothetical protein